MHRIGTNTNKVDVLDDTPEEIISLSLGNKLYEMSNHLGNVLTVINDIKVPQSANTTDIDGYLATIVSTADYSPFGVQLDERTESAETYRYGFQGQEKDDEMKGAGNSYDFGARFHDPRLGRFVSLDPLKSCFPDISPYQFAGNSPLWKVDVKGMSAATFQTNPPFQNGLIVLKLDLILGPNLSFQSVGVNYHKDFTMVKEDFGYGIFYPYLTMGGTVSQNGNWTMNAGVGTLSKGTMGSGDNGQQVATLNTQGLFRLSNFVENSISVSSTVKPGSVSYPVNEADAVTAYGQMQTSQTLGWANNYKYTAIALTFDDYVAVYYPSFQKKSKPLIGSPLLPPLQTYSWQPTDKTQLMLEAAFKDYIHHIKTGRDIINAMQYNIDNPPHCGPTEQPLFSSDIIDESELQDIDLNSQNYTWKAD